MKTIKATAFFCLTLVLLFTLNQRIGSVPPLGKFMNPFGGFWSNAERGNPASQRDMHIPDINEPVTVVYDRRGVPHIFAENDRDLYFTQGFVTARDRLWQMEFQTHAAAGRISELIGEVAIEYDRFQRRIGMVYGAEKALDEIMSDSTSRAVFEAYSEGVNAYIQSLNRRNLPIEYKILDYQPEAWTPLKIALLMKSMTQTLTGSSDLQMTNTLNLLGPELMGKLFPRYPPGALPIIPENTQWDLDPVSVRKPQRGFVPRMMENGFRLVRDPGIGSNNWAVDGSLTASGKPILSNDPHLNLTLPSLWYEIQLSAPDVNVYGASLPGAPTVVIGFNDHITWGVTNSGADVMDLYEIEFVDDNPDHYLYDGKRVAFDKRIEKIKVRNSGTIRDTVLYTRHGPVTQNLSDSAFADFTAPGHALRWVAHEPSNEILTFHKLNRARNYESFVEALSHFTAPPQNFAYADTGGNIALWVNGRFPLRWEGQGKYISDGRDPLHEWQGWIPHRHNPHHKNPPEGFVASANQLPAGKDYPYYLGWNFASNERGKRIHELLHQAEGIDLRFMQNMLTDDRSLHAESILPLMLDRLETGRRQKNTQQMVLDRLYLWDYHHLNSSKAATVFHHWWKKTYRLAWETVYEHPENDDLKYPERDQTVYLMSTEPELFTGNLNGEPVNLSVIINLAFHKTLDSLSEEHGDWGKNWQWGHDQSTHIQHLAGISGLGSGDLFTSGADGTLNATRRGNNGPSWRMVVDLDNPVRGFGIYPGGQSGNPGSSHYDSFIGDWVKGELYELLFLQSPDDQHDEIVYRLKFYCCPA